MKIKPDILDFHVVGTDFLKADTAMRSRFALTNDNVNEIYSKVKSTNTNNFFILSTCNRTEFYGCMDLSVLTNIVSQHLRLTAYELKKYFYVLKGMEAIRHFFRLVSGMESQIIGDYEIYSQVKTAINKARSFGLIGMPIDRISNFAFQASKNIKNKTSLSSGQYSVSYAAAELLYHQTHLSPVDKVLLIGTGRFGLAVGRNIRKRFPNVKLWLSNRTVEKAIRPAEELGASVLSFKELGHRVNDFEVIVVTAGVSCYLIESEHLQPGRTRLLLDLSMPRAVNPEVGCLDGVQLFNVDAVSAFHNQLLNRRLHELPRAQRIVDCHIEQLVSWYRIYSKSHLVWSYREIIKELAKANSPSGFLPDDNLINKTFRNLICHFKESGYHGCRVIETMNSLTWKV